MKTLETLIRLAGFTVDERRRALSVILDREAEFYQRIERLDADYDRERILATENPEYATHFGGFAARYKRQRTVVENRISALQPAIQKARQDLAEAFEEQKRYEITLDQRIEEQRLDEKRKEQAELDEIAATKNLRS